MAVRCKPMPVPRQITNRIIEKLGLDWLVMLLGRPAFEDAPLLYAADLAGVRGKFSDLRGNEKLEDAVDYCAELLKREKDRADKVETKAFSLIGNTGITVTLIVGLGGLLFIPGRASLSCVLVAIGVFYIVAVFSLVFTIYLALKVVNVTVPLHLSERHRYI